MLHKINAILEFSTSNSWFLMNYQHHFLKFRADKKILPGLQGGLTNYSVYWIISNTCINQNFTYHLRLKLRSNIVKTKDQATLYRQVKNVGSCNGDVRFHMMQRKVCEQFYLSRSLLGWEWLRVTIAVSVIQIKKPKHNLFQLLTFELILTVTMI